MQTGAKQVEKQNLVNHVVLVIDGSSSMIRRAADLIKVVDNQVARLARLSTQTGQETRVSVYSFADQVQCIIWDTDVLRMPSIADIYHPYGNTALLDAVGAAIEDMQTVPTKHGDHSFLLYAATDGQENCSRRFTGKGISKIIGSLPEEWTVGVFVPDQLCKRDAVAYGFHRQNVAVWDVDTGVGEVDEAMSDATESYFAMRSTGVRGTKTLFTTKDVSAATVSAAGMKPVDPANYMLLPVTPTPDHELTGEKYEDPLKPWIKQFVERCGLQFQVGKGYYQLAKRELVQGNKRIAIVNRKTSKVYVGGDARALLGLSDNDTRISPEFNPDWDVYVQSTSTNRKLPVGTKLLYFVA